MIADAENCNVSAISIEHLKSVMTNLQMNIFRI